MNSTSKKIGFFFTIFSTVVLGKIVHLPERNATSFATGFSEICKATGSESIVIFIKNKTTKTRKLNEFIQEVQKLHVLTYLFVNDQQQFLDFIESLVRTSVETSSIIFARPDEIIDEIQERNLAHRLSLFMFYWGLERIQDYEEIIEVKEPLKVVYITHPRKKVYRVYFNRASSDGSGKMKMVNWFDATSLGLHHEPLLPITEEVYKKLAWRTVFVPAVHTPPWLQVNYKSNESSVDNNATESVYDFMLDNDKTGTENDTVYVSGGRDDALLRFIANRMQFNIKYIEPPERTQGTASDTSEGNLNFTGGIGMIQRREADLFLGDIPLSWDRKQAVEFTFFTLADAGVFVTHSPRKLNEALILIRPFMWNVWPVLLVTVLITVPAFYFIIIMPYIWKDHYKYFIFMEARKKVRNRKDVEQGQQFYYLNEITYGRRSEQSKLIDYKGVPTGMFGKVSWFVVNLYLKQSVALPFKGHRARFLTIVIWLGATYVLSDMYSAQLTSQLARPAKEAPINTLHRLEAAMRHKQYFLYVEKDSAAQTIIENGTGTFERLFKLMKHQPKFCQSNEKPYEVNSIHDGMLSILEHGSRAILGGKGTIYFNTKMFGANNFQISEKLYTRYSAFVVQNGCLFLDSLNRIIMSLFEGGILDQMTTIEYEKNFGIQNTNGGQEQEGSKLPQQVGQNANKKKQEGSGKLQPISINMLQGAFFMLLIGYTSAGVILLVEIVESKFGFLEKSLEIIRKLIFHGVTRNVRRLAKATWNLAVEVIHELF